MDKNSKVIMKKQLNVTDLAGEKVMVDFESGKYFMIKGCGNDIWDMIQEGKTIQEIIDGLLAEYEVSAEECESAVIQFIEKMKSYDFVE